MLYKLVYNSSIMSDDSMLYFGIEQIHYVWWLYALYCIEQMSDDSMLNHIGIEHICYVWRL